MYEFAPKTLVIDDNALVDMARLRCVLTPLSASNVMIDVPAVSPNNKF